MTKEQYLNCIERKTGCYRMKMHLYFSQNMTLAQKIAKQPQVRSSKKVNSPELYEYDLYLEKTCFITCSTIEFLVFTLKTKKKNFNISRF